MLEIVARYADTWNSSGTVEELRARNQLLDEKCAAIGRDPTEVVRSLYGWAAVMPNDPWASVEAFREVIGRYREAGIEEFIIDQPPEAQLGVLERVATDVIPSLRAAQA